MSAGRPPMKLRARLSLTVTGVTAVALLASFAAVFLLVRRDETRDLDYALAVQARATAQLAYAKDPKNPVVADGTAEVPESIGPTARYIAVYDVVDGSTLSATDSFGGAAPTLEALGVAPPVPWDGQPVNLVVRSAALRGVIVPMSDRRHALLYAASRRTGAQGNLDARVSPGSQGSAETRALAADLDHMIENAPPRRPSSEADAAPGAVWRDSGRTRSLSSRSIRERCGRADLAIPRRESRNSTPGARSPTSPRFALPLRNRQPFGVRFAIPSC